MSEEEDWFERALRELDEGSEGDDAPEGDGTDETDGDENDDEDDDEDDGNDGGRNESDEAEVTADDGTGRDDESALPEDVDGNEDDETAESDPFGGYRSEAVDGSDRDDGSEAVDGGDENDDPGRGGGADGSDVSDDPFGGGGDGSFGEGDPFGGGGGSFGENDPFGGGGGSFGEGDPFGGGSGGGGDGTADGPTGFDEADAEEFDSDIERTDVGIEGLDAMILGGVPSRSLLTVIGGAGTGKTTFSLQFLNEALESDERGVYITLEQSRESILSTAEEKGWPFRQYAEEGTLAVVSLDPIEMANSLASIRNDLTRLIADFGADRLVLDSVSLLEMMYDHPAKRRSEVFGFTRLLKEAGVTTLLTSEASDGTPYASRYGLVEYLTDGVFVLQYVRGSDFRETRLAVEIQKIRDANHSRETKPYEITNEGISVYRQANIF
ncbi:MULTISPECIES: KaiC domain-containing protein [Haloferacaceae]|uniref:KaiC domain-containing protein n=1 Tax=Halorubrum glutamatedens TaxID=2707018 RepID=A0ABD5QNY3_9EURY|nr:KaiC domain-containing protein [Halobellus captivus]